MPCLIEISGSRYDVAGAGARRGKLGKCFVDLRVSGRVARRPDFFGGGVRQKVCFEQRRTCFQRLILWPDPLVPE